MNLTTAVSAAYTPQTIIRMRGNPLIEALPPAMTDDQVFEALALAPDYSEEQRTWENHQRVQQIRGLSNFMVPLARHLELARMLDSMMREGYVGRAPRTKEFVTKLQRMYEMQKAGKTFTQGADTVAVQDSAALLGVSGMGKSTTVRRWLSHYPRVIFHNELNVTQVTYVHVDLSSDGNSVKALAIAVISQLDRLLPEHDYHRLYLQNTARTSTEALIHTVGRLLALHHVGLLVADEVQNLCNSKKGAQVVMTELVTMCNMLNVPILFIGTNKASEVLAADFRQARRSTGVCIAPWTRMPRFDPPQYCAEGDSEGSAQTSEWADFMHALWKYQWVRTPLQLTEDILDLLYSCTQGVLDLAIKLFAIAQVRAVLEGHDTLSTHSLKQAYESDFKLLHEAIEALERNDFKTLERFADIKPLKLDEAVANLTARASIQSARNRLAKPGDPTFKTQVAAAAMASGFDAQSAHHIAEEIESDGTAKDTVDALGQIRTKLKPPKQSGKGKPHSDAKKKKESAKVAWPDFASRPHDYRQALKLAQEQKTSVLDQLKALGMAQNVELLVPLD